MLREWFESHRDKYDEPARYDFQEAALSGDSSEAAVRAFVDALNGGTPGDAKAGLRVFKGRPHANLVAELRRRVRQGARSRRRRASGARCTTRDGWRAMRLDAITPPKPAVFEALRGVVLQDWTDATLAEQRTAAVRALAQEVQGQVRGAARTNERAGCARSLLLALVALALLRRAGRARTR